MKRKPSETVRVRQQVSEIEGELLALKTAIMSIIAASGGPDSATNQALRRFDLPALLENAPRSKSPAQKRRRQLMVDAAAKTWRDLLQVADLQA